MMTFIDDGERRPFDPRAVAAHLSGCVLCGRRVTTVGVFLPETEEMRAVVLRLRRSAVPSQSTSAIAYGLCRHHLAQESVTDHVEAALIAAADRVVVQ